MPKSLAKDLAAGPRLDLKKTRVLTLDIETTPNLVWAWGLKNQFVSINQIEDHTRMMCFVAKWYDEDEPVFFSEHHHGRDEMVRQAWKLINEADIVIHFNGSSFDMKHLNREFLFHGLTPPAPYKEIDLMRQVIRQFKLPSYKLDYIVQYFNLGAKLAHTGFDLWKGCMAGEKKPWKLMRRYNLQDVHVTEMLFEHLRKHGWLKGTPHLGLFEDKEWCCPLCLSKKMKRNGTVKTAVTVYANYTCQRCGKHVRANHRKAVVTSRESR